MHFEIQADKPERAIKFYTDVFGREFQEWKVPKDMQDGGLAPKYWMIMTAPKNSTEKGINGGLLPRMGGTSIDGQAVNAYVCTTQVENIDDTIKKIDAGGGTVALPKFAFSGMVWQAYYKDTEGNIFGIHQPDKNAK